MKYSFYYSLKIALNILSLLCLANIASGQDTEYKKNSIYGGFGTNSSANHASLAYERLLHPKNNLNTKIKLNFGVRTNNQRNTVYNEKVTQSYGSLSAVQLLSIIELNAGVAIRIYKFGFNNTPISFTEEYYRLRSDFQFYGNVGLRFEIDSFLIRAGIGNFDLMYFGIGVNI